MAAVMVSPVYLAASVGPLARFIERHLWILGVVTAMQVAWIALESFQGDSRRSRWCSALVHEGLSLIPAAIFWGCVVFDAVAAAYVP